MKDIRTFVAEYEIFQQQKGKTMKPLGELQPLPIQLAVWTNISMDFIVGLPKLGNKSVIMVVVHHLSNIFIFVLYNTPSRPL